MAHEDLDLNSKEYCELGDYMRAEAAKMLKKQEEYVRRAPLMRPEQRKAEEEALKQMDADFHYKMITANFASERWLVRKVFANELNKFTVFSFEEVDRVIKDHFKISHFKSLLPYLVIKETRNADYFNSILKRANIKYV